MKNAVTQGFDDAACELYKQVMIKRAWLAEKDLPGNAISHTNKTCFAAPIPSPIGIVPHDFQELIEFAVFI